jgi:hypothetical protein
MTSRWLASDGLVERRAGGGSHVPSPTAVWIGRVQKSVEVALRPDQREAHHGFELLYHAVRERAVELKEGGWRADQALMAMKREVAACVAGTVTPHASPDAARVPALLDAVVRWTVATFYVGN